MDFLKKVIFFVFIFNPKIFADMYCPDTVICTNNTCVGYPFPNPVFSWIRPGNIGDEIPDGTYYFSAAYSNLTNAFQCQYRDQEGHSWAYYVTKKLLIPNAKSSVTNSWIGFASGNIDFYCGPNTQAPYLADPKRCPFIDDNKIT